MLQSVASTDSVRGVAGEGTPTEADIGFCADMTLHHVQALAMCQRVLGREARLHHPTVGGLEVLLAAPPDLLGQAAQLA